ncbi:tape measure chaperone [Stenotrophomonas phage Suzuki]|nr:tape measure chaperone [Stenotrophomonas phage Suzuki]
MSLSTLRLRTITVPYQGADGEHPITLYGLNANDVAGILIVQKDNLEGLFDIVQGAGVKSAADLAEADMLKIAQTLMVQMPDFIARVIAYASHEPEEWHVALQLDLPTQVKCLRAIADLTFKDEAGFREFLGKRGGGTARRKGRGAAKPKSRLERFAEWWNGIRAAVSFLISEGHPNASEYPLGVLIVETEIARERVNNRLKTEALLIQGAIGSALTKKGAQAFKEQISEL